MRKPFVAGNWKMNLDRREAVELLTHLKSFLHDLHDEVDVVVCPPSVYLDLSYLEIKLSNIKLGAQNVAATTNQAATGEVSAQMLREFGCEYVIIGHSERRAMLGETDGQIAAKFAIASDAGITPIICVGEESGDGFAVVSSQLQAVVDKLGMQAFENTVIAYEPVWAIGTGKTASPEQVQEMHEHIRELITTEVRIIYGGSVKPENAEEIFDQHDVDGGLIGGASLKARDFSDICHVAMSVAKK